MTRRLASLAAVAVGLSAVALALSTQQAGEEPPVVPAGRVPSPSLPPPSRALPQVERYEPDPEEPYSNAKRIAGRAAARLSTYRRDQTAERIAAAVARGRGAGPRDAVRRLLRPNTDSVGEVVYVQLSGVTRSTIGLMVVVRQTTVGPKQARKDVTRTIDVRLRRNQGPWRLDRIASIGGTPVPRPSQLSSAARRVLDHPRIELPDSARWDIHAGRIDERLLEALAQAADRRSIAVTCLRTGHPRNVWATARRSAHHDGLAADIHAVDGTPVVQQRQPGSAAVRLARRLVAGGAAQVGSPWVLGREGRRSFTDATHQDHLHLQQAQRSSDRVSGG